MHYFTCEKFDLINLSFKKNITNFSFKINCFVFPLKSENYRIYSDLFVEICSVLNLGF